MFWSFFPIYVRLIDFIISFFNIFSFALAAKKLLKRTPLVDPSRHKEKEKRSIEIGDRERVDLDNGKELLVAYLGGIADYRRQIRSVDDDDDDDFLADDGE